MVRRDEAERRSTCHSGAAPTCRSSHCQRNSASEAFRNKKHMKRKKRRLTGLTPSSVKSNRENGFPITEGASGNSTGMERRHTISERTYRHALPKIRSLRPADHAVLPVPPGRNRFQSPATFDDYRFEIGTDSTETARSACSKRNGNRYAAEPSPTRRGRPSHSRSSRPCERARRGLQEAKRRFPARTRRPGSSARSAGNRASRPIRRA